MTRVCSNCDKTTSQSQGITEISVIFITNLQSLYYRQQQLSAIASLLDGEIILSLILFPRGRAPFGQHQELRPLARSKDIPVLNGFVSTID